MGYTVVHKSGMTKDHEFAAYVRLLEQDGVDITNTPRVADAEGNRWLYVWESPDDANEFARRLQKETKDTRWEVRELASVEPSRGPLGPIEILVGRQSDGCTYGLSPTSRKLIRKRYPEARMAPSVFISTDTQSDFEATQGPIWDQVAIILTGLSEDKLREFGGYRIYDPMNKRNLRKAPLVK
jgi:hypothetical protein